MNLASTRTPTDRSEKGGGSERTKGGHEEDPLYKAVARTNAAAQEAAPEVEKPSAWSRRVTKWQNKSKKREPQPQPWSFALDVASLDGHSFASAIATERANEAFRSAASNEYEEGETAEEDDREKEGHDMLASTTHHENRNHAGKPAAPQKNLPEKPATAAAKAKAAPESLFERLAAFTAYISCDPEKGVQIMGLDQFTLDDESSSDGEEEQDATTFEQDASTFEEEEPTVEVSLVLDDDDAEDAKAEKKSLWKKLRMFNNNNYEKEDDVPNLSTIVAASAATGACAMFWPESEKQRNKRGDNDEAVSESRLNKLDALLEKQESRSLDTPVKDNTAVAGNLSPSKREASVEKAQYAIDLFSERPTDDFYAVAPVNSLVEEEERNVSQEEDRKTHRRPRSTDKGAVAYWRSRSVDRVPRAATHRRSRSTDKAAPQPLTHSRSRSVDTPRAVTRPCRSIEKGTSNQSRFRSIDKRPETPAHRRSRSIEKLERRCHGSVVTAGPPFRAQSTTDILTALATADISDEEEDESINNKKAAFKEDDARLASNKEKVRQNIHRMRAIAGLEARDYVEPAALVVAASPRRSNASASASSSSEESSRKAPVQRIADDKQRVQRNISRMRTIAGIDHGGTNDKSIAGGGSRSEILTGAPYRSRSTADVSVAAKHAARPVDLQAYLRGPSGSLSLPGVNSHYADDDAEPAQDIEQEFQAINFRDDEEEVEEEGGPFHAAHVQDKSPMNLFSFLSLRSITGKKGVPSEIPFRPQSSCYDLRKMPGVEIDTEAGAFLDNTMSLEEEEESLVSSLGVGSNLKLLTTVPLETAAAARTTTTAAQNMRTDAKPKKRRPWWHLRWSE